MHSDNDAPILHVYAQDAPHADLHIMGNRQGLRWLIHALETALLAPESSQVTCVDFFCTDGEGFDVIIHWETEEEATRRYLMPYTAEEYQDAAHEPNPYWPCTGP